MIVGQLGWLVQYAQRLQELELSKPYRASIVWGGKKSMKCLSLALVPIKNIPLALEPTPYPLIINFIENQTSSQKIKVNFSKLHFSLPKTSS